MSLNTAALAIRAKFEAEWPALEPTVPIAYPDPLVQPQSGEYLLLDITWAGGSYLTIGSPGNNQVRRDGWIWLNAFIPTGRGQIRAFEIAHKAAKIFEGQSFGADGVVCRQMEPGAGISGTGEGLWYGQSVAVSFYFDEFA